MAKSKTRSLFVCQSCGAQRPKWEGKCSDCGTWNSFKEETLVQETEGKRGWSLGSSDKPAARTVSLDKKLEETPDNLRYETSYGELDRVLGGGLVQGSFLLLGGDPGVGKSTLLMHMAGGLAEKKLSVLYISAEESVNQTGLRAQRLGVNSSHVHIGSESNMDVIVQLVENKKPDVLIVDSIQTVFLPEITSAPGSVSQVRECAGHLMTLAKNKNISVFLIGHVTKEGNIAGPKVLEHMVDTVLSFEGDMTHQFRLLRAVKNRFGPTHELGVFQMASDGLKEVDNPSELFLEERGSQLIGSTVFASMEGSRPLLVEVQALASYSALTIPRRTSIGFDINRVHLLLAVLTKHANVSFSQSDVFVNVVGGLKVIEPAADLAIAAALLSSEGNQEVAAQTCFFGEIGLTGEVRAVPFCDQRIMEANKLGFETFVVPASNKKHLKDLDPKILSKIVWIQRLKDLAQIFGRKRARKAKTVKALEN